MQYFTTTLGHEKALTTHAGGAVIYPFPSSSYREALETVRQANEIIRQPMSQVGQMLFNSFSPITNEIYARHYAVARSDLFDAYADIHVGRDAHNPNDRKIIRLELIHMLSGVASAVREILSAYPEWQNERDAADNLNELLANRRDGV